MTAVTQRKTPQWFIIIWFIILLFFAFWKIANGQERGDLPILNQKILHYVDSVENTKVGKGLCRHFVNEAIIYATGEKFKKTRRLDLAGLYAFEGYNLPRKHSLPGDIVYMTGHVGIIVKIYTDTCYIKIAHQSEGTPVIIEDFNLCKRFQVKYIRIKRLY